VVSPDLAALLGWPPSTAGARPVDGWFRVPAQLAGYWRIVVVVTEAQRPPVIAAHCDLGNDFYRLFLDGP
jgi:hypothetical protein